MEEFEVKMRGTQTTAEWCTPVSKMSHHMVHGEGLDTRGMRIVKAFGTTYRNISPALDCGCRGFTGDRRSPIPYMRCYRDTIHIVFQFTIRRLTIPNHNTFSLYKITCHAYEI